MYLSEFYRLVVMMAAVMTLLLVGAFSLASDPVGGEITKRSEESQIITIDIGDVTAPSKFLKPSQAMLKAIQAADERTKVSYR